MSKRKVGRSRAASRLIRVKKPYRSAAFLEAAKEKRAQAAIERKARALSSLADYFIWKTKEIQSRREIARLKMPMPITALGNLLVCFSDEFIGSYAKQEGEYLIVYVDVEDAGL